MNHGADSRYDGYTRPESREREYARRKSAEVGGGTRTDRDRKATETGEDADPGGLIVAGGSRIGVGCGG